MEEKTLAELAKEELIELEFEKFYRNATITGVSNLDKTPIIFGTVIGFLGFAAAFIALGLITELDGFLITLSYLIAMCIFVCFGTGIGIIFAERKEREKQWERFKKMKALQNN